MKYRYLFYLLVSLSLMMPACTDSDDEIGGQDTPPAGALPSAEFKPNNLPDEPYAGDAIRVVVEDENAPFYSLELMPDGYYLLTDTRPYSSYAPTVRVAAETNGNFSICKNRKAKTMRAKSRTDENGTVTLYNGEYGKFTKLNDKKYRLSNGIEIDLQDVAGAEKTMVYRNYDGTVSRVAVRVSEPILKNGTKSLCRTWNYNSFETWGYWNGRYLFHGKQTLNNGKVDSYFNAIGGDLLDIDREDFLDGDDEMCYKVVFTSVGTYICFFCDGDVEVSLWQWTNEAQGTLHYEDSAANEDYDEDWDGYVTVRFSGNQMRVYEDYTDSEEGMTMRVVAVNTLTAAN